ncbi:MAG: hypothetical protein ACPGUE_11325 [Marinomonas sp.]
MDFSIVLVGLSLYILIWEKLPDWGTWFNYLIERLPAPLAYLYQAWRCPYCFGFWVALVLHYLTGSYTLAAMHNMPEAYGVIGTYIGVFLDSLVAALLIMLGKLSLSALAGPAITGHEKTLLFKQAKAK